MSTTLRFCTGVSSVSRIEPKRDARSVAFDKHPNLSGVMTALQATGSEIKFIVSFKSIPSITINKIDYYIFNPHMTMLIFFF